MTTTDIGRLYIFEGIDNVGKTTIIKHVSGVLKSKNISCSTYSFPGKDPYTLGALIYDFHHNKDKYITQDINNISLQLLHVASHIDLLIRCIIPDLKLGKTVLLDRSWWSTYAYGLANGINEKEIEMIIASELSIFESIDVGKIFLINREQKTSDYDKITTRKIIEVYEDLALKYQPSGLIQIINNNSNILKVVAKINTEIIKQINIKSNIDFIGKYNHTERKTII